MRSCDCFSLASHPLFFLIGSKTSNQGSLQNFIRNFFTPEINRFINILIKGAVHPNQIVKLGLLWFWWTDPNHCTHYHSVWSSRPKMNFMVTMMRAAVWTSYRGRMGRDKRSNRWSVWSVKPARSISLQTHGWSSSGVTEETSTRRIFWALLALGSIVGVCGAVTGQVNVGQVAKAEQRRVQQTLTADWRKSRKLQEQNQRLSLLMHRLVGRDTLWNKTSSH